jgi:branched-chain amino acid transport system ATP-binding protein
MSILEVENLTKSFGSNRAVDNVSLRIEEGEFVSFVGSNGAGKTSFCNLVTALLMADSGSIAFNGRDITRSSIVERIRLGIARSFQLVNLFDDMDSSENVALAILARQGKTRRIATFASRDSAVRDEADAILKQFGLSGRNFAIVRDLSQGERKLLDVAVAFALRPKLLFLDEPTSGVGTRDKIQIMETVDGAVRQSGTTVVIVEHDMDVVFKYSDRVVAMHQGAVVAQGTPDEIKSNQLVASMLFGTATFPKGH